MGVFVSWHTLDTHSDTEGCFVANTLDCTSSNLVTETGTSTLWTVQSSVGAMLPSNTSLATMAGAGTSHYLVSSSTCVTRMFREYQDTLGHPKTLQLEWLSGMKSWTFRDIWNCPPNPDYCGQSWTRLHYCIVPTNTTGCVV